MFRDWLRARPDDRDAWGAHKVGLAALGSADVIDNNTHKPALVYDLYETACAADPEHQHDPQPRP